MKRVIIFIIGFVVFQQAGYGQSVDSTNTKYWIDAGLGGYVSAEGTSGITGALGLNLNRGSRLYKLRFLNQAEFSLAGPEPSEDIYSGGIMVGKAIGGSRAEVQLSAGIGVTGGMKRGILLNPQPKDKGLLVTGVYEEEKFMTVSIPLQVDFMPRPAKYLGFAISFYGDLNFVRPACGFVLKLAVGKLR